MWRQSANHSLSLRWTYKTAPLEFQTKLLHYVFLSNNKSNLHFISDVCQYFRNDSKWAEPNAAAKTRCRRLTRKEYHPDNKMAHVIAHKKQDAVLSRSPKAALRRRRSRGRNTRCQKGSKFMRLGCASQEAIYARSWQMYQACGCKGQMRMYR